MSRLLFVSRRRIPPWGQLTLFRHAFFGVNCQTCSRASGPNPFSILGLANWNQGIPLMPLSTNICSLNYIKNHDNIMPTSHFI